jgi:hypothetical protein
MHSWPAAQERPHAPQFARSIDRSRHTPLQLVSPAPQTQAPPVQSSPAAHSVPHPPQFNRSVERSRHTPLQFVWPAPQVTVQTPLEHT